LLGGLQDWHTEMGSHWKGSSPASSRAALNVLYQPVKTADLLFEDRKHSGGIALTA
jgi:hypothetical protein